MNQNGIARFSCISWKSKELFDVAISYFCRFCWSPRSFSSAPESSWETRSLLYKSPWTSSAVRRSSDKTFRFYRAKAGTLPEFFFCSTITFSETTTSDNLVASGQLRKLYVLERLSLSVCCDNGDQSPFYNCKAFNQIYNLKFTPFELVPIIYNLQFSNLIESAGIRLIFENIDPLQGWSELQPAKSRGVLSQYGSVVIELVWASCCSADWELGKQVLTSCCISSIELDMWDLYSIDTGWCNKLLLYKRVFLTAAF